MRSYCIPGNFVREKVYSIAHRNPETFVKKSNVAADVGLCIRFNLSGFPKSWQDDRLLFSSFLTVSDNTRLDAAVQAKKNG